MPDTMLAARAYEGEDEFRVEEIPVPSIGTGEVLVRIVAAGMTRGLLTLWRSGRIQLLPATLGNEGAGIVAAVGPDVAGIEVGDRVRVHAPLTCGYCYWCQTDRTGCPKVSLIGHAIYSPAAMPMYEKYHNGMLAEFVKVPATNLDPLPENIPFDVAARIHDLGVSFHSMRRTDPTPGSTLVVNGATGANGASCVLLAPVFGITKVIAVSRTRVGLERIRALAPDLVEIVALEELPDGWESDTGWDGSGPLTARIREVAGGFGPDGVVDFMPAQPAVTVQSMLAMRKSGVIALTGGNRSTLAIPYSAVMVNSYEIRGAQGLTRRDARDMIGLIASGRIDPRPLITHRFALAEVNEAMRTIDGRIGDPQFVIVEPPGTAEWLATHATEQVVPAVGGTYEIEIVDEFDSQWTGPLGIARMGGVDIRVPNAKRGESYRVSVATIETNQWTHKPTADVEVLAGPWPTGPGEAPAEVGAVGPTMDAEVGQEYEVTVVDEFDSPWTGPLGIARVGDVDVRLPNAKIGDVHRVRVRSIEVNQWTNRPTADVDWLTEPAPTVPAVEPSEPAMREWVAVARTEEVAVDSVKRVKIGDASYALVNTGGELRALSGLCPHRDGPLATGDLVDGEIVCPWHNFRFDVRTGECTMPAGYRPAAAYATRVVDGMIEVEVPATEA